MSLLNADILEPVNIDGKISIVTVREGEHQVHDASQLMHNEEFSKEERTFFKNLVKLITWPLPKDFTQKEYRQEFDHRLRDYGKMPPIDLSSLHSRICKYLRRYLWFSTDESYDLVANWVISTYLRPWFHYAPLLIFDGVTRSGKSTVLKTLKQVVYRGNLNTNYSAASIARQIETLDTTMLLDESQDNIESERGQEVVSMLKSCFEKGSTWIRADPKSKNLNVYNVYTSTALAIKGVNLAEDVYNRGIRIGMIGMPQNLELWDIDSVNEDDTEGDSTPEQLRTELYALRMCFACPDSEGRVPVDLKELKERARDHFKKKTENGEWLYAFIHNLKKAPKIDGRPRNIANTLYTIGLATLSERETLKMIIDNEDVTRQEIIDTPEAIAFFAILDILFAKRNDKPLYKIGDTIDTKFFDDIVSEISTVDIAIQFNRIQAEQGNAGRDPVPTKSVTAKIKALGLEYTPGKQNRSYLRPEKPLFKPTFLQHVRTYAPEYLDLFDFGSDGEVKTIYNG